MDIIQKISEKLINNHLTISVAESLTGGLLSSKFVDFSGASSFFVEGVVTYSDEAKISRLGVKKETLQKFSAVSEEVATEMAIGVSKNLNTDIGISTTGVAGPNSDGINEVGLVFVGIYINEKVYVFRYNFSGNRNEIRNETVKYALNELYNKLDGCYN